LKSISEICHIKTKDQLNDKYLHWII